MKIAEFDQIPLRSRVIYKRKEYILIDRIKRTHEAIIATKKPEILSLYGKVFRDQVY